VQAFSGTYQNVWGDLKPFQVSAAVLFDDEIADDGQAYHTYGYYNREGRPRSGAPLTIDEDGVVTGSVWQNDAEYSANLYTQGTYAAATGTITHETAHLLGVEDGYAYDMQSEGFSKPRASLNLLPEMSLMVTAGWVTNLEMRMIFEAQYSGVWQEFEDYEDEFVYYNATSRASIRSSLSEEEQARFDTGNALVGGRIMVTFKDALW